MPVPPIVTPNHEVFQNGYLVDGRWTVTAFLGEGTFGRVYQVKDVDGKLYALKMLKVWAIPAKDRENLLKRFDREYETGLLDSPYLVKSWAKGCDKEVPYFVMDYCQGGDIRKPVTRSRLDLALLARHILLGLRDLHANGKVHRDLKPENVLLMDDHHAVLTDFGISGDQNNRLTKRGLNGNPGQRFGTIAYMPPEQLNPSRDNATVLPTTDIYSFGVMMYRLLTHELPFGPLSSPADMVTYTTNAMTGRWNRGRLLDLEKGYEWLPVIEGCLVPDFQRRLPSADRVLAILPQPLSQSANTVIPPIPASVSYETDMSRGISLKVTSGDQQGAVFNLRSLFTDRTHTIFIGRESDVCNHISLIESETCYISRRHCTIEFDTATGKWYLSDGQCRDGCRNRSLNGTFLNSKIVDDKGSEIKAGDIITIGPVTMRVEGLSQINENTLISKTNKY